MSATKTKRKPVTMKHRHGFLTHRDAIWSAIRNLKQFGYLDIEQMVNVQTDEKLDRVSTETVRTYVKRLALGGYIKETEEIKVSKDTNDRYFRKQWELVNDVGIDAPVLTKDGKTSESGKMTKKIWNSIKILKKFSWKDVAVMSSTEELPIKERYIREYLENLRKARYIRLIQKGDKSRPSLYQFIPAKNSGPLAPMLRYKKEVFDQNIRAVVWAEGNES